MPQKLLSAELDRLSESDLARSLDIHHCTLLTPPQCGFIATDWTHFGKEVQLLNDLLGICAKYDLLPQDIDEHKCLDELDRRQALRRIPAAALA